MNTRSIVASVLCLLSPSDAFRVVSKPEALAGGADWTNEEVLKVLAKINKVFELNTDNGRRKTESREMMEEILNGKTYECQENIAGKLSDCSDTEASKLTQGQRPNAAKFLRLGFHDCVPYEDGTGGCDGCLNFENMFVKFNTEKKLTLPDDADGRNNNLALTADTLERIYTNASFLSSTPELAQSLQAGGKSRADLWALATLYSAYWAVQNNNDYCKSSDPNKGNVANQEGRECEIKPSKPLQFKSGRIDCPASIRPDMADTSKFYKRRAYESTIREELPSPNADGKTTAEWFEKHFNFNARQTVVILGVHGFGSFNLDTSLFKYTWTRQQHDLLNNEYYRVISLKKSFNKHRDPFRAVGGPGRTPSNWTGALAETRWFVHDRNNKKSHGNFVWAEQWKRCADCVYTNGKWESRENPSAGDAVFRSDSCCEECTKAPDDPTIDDRCFKFVSRFDNKFLGVDAGLYLDFKFDNTTGGRPHSCNFLPLNKKWKNTVADCQLQTYTGTDTKPMHQIVEEYADNQSLWFDDFSKTLVKMLENGQGDLKAVPFSLAGVTCTKTAPYECVKATAQ